MLFKDFYLLSITERQVRFYKGTHHDLKLIKLDELPSNMQDVLGETVLEKQLQFHSGAAGGNPIFHGHYGDLDLERNNLKKYLRVIESCISTYLYNHQEPLIIATTEKTFAEYKKLNNYSKLVNEFIHGNYEYSNEQKLQQKAIDLLKRSNYDRN